MLLHMSVALLPEAVSADLASRDLSYADVGGTAGELPTGYHHVRRWRVLPAGTQFEATARALMQWQVQVRSGLRVEASNPIATLGTDVVMRLGVGRFSIAAPCRVIRVVDERDRRGFAYGTLAGHPESGEESFSVTHLANGDVRFDIVAFSLPRTRLARVGGPVTPAVQRFVTNRYLRSLDRV
jgi:uncharacterized protein (UPF0548 family)